MSIADRLEKIESALTVTQLARVLSVSSRTIYQYAASGRIPSIKIGSAVRFDPAVIASWLRSKGSNL